MLYVGFNFEGVSIYGGALFFKWFVIAENQLANVLVQSIYISFPAIITEF